MTNTNNLTNELLNNAPATETTAPDTPETVDYTKYLSNLKYAQTVTFNRGFFYDAKGNFYIRYTDAEGKHRSALAEPDTYYESLKGMTMKVAIDQQDDPWMFIYPNAESHPRPVKEETPQELINFRNRIFKK